MEPEVRKAPARLYEIDLLRFLAAFSVVLFHYTYFAYRTAKWSPIPYLEIGRFSRYGYLGVELFFMISGFVILQSAQGKTIKQFFIARVARLYPAFWAACTLTFVVEAIWGTKPVDVQMSDTFQSTPVQYLYNMTMLQSFVGVQAIDAVYWSLSLELVFYFLVAVLMAFGLLPHLNLLILLWLGYAGLPGLAHYGTPFFSFLFPSFAPYFAAGMLFCIMQNPAERTWKRWGLLAMAFVLALRAAVNQAKEASLSSHGDTSWKIALVIVAVFFILLGLIAFRKINLGKYRWLAQLGALTYPLYLLHSDVAFIIFHRLGHQVNKYVLLVVVLLGMLGLAWGVHTVVEKRLSRPLANATDRLLTLLGRV